MLRSSYWYRSYLPTCLFASLVMAVSLLDLPHTPADVTLDQSWRIALGFFASRKFQFGPQVIYTYGPLAYLTEALYSGDGLRTLLMGRVLLACGAAAVFGYVGWVARSYRLIAFLVAETVLFGHYEHDSVFLTVSAMMACLCISLAASGVLLCLTALILGFTALIKFTFLVQSCVLAVALMGFLLITRQRGRLLLFVCACGLSLAGLWLGPAHQDLAGFPSFVRRSFQVAAGYNEAMSSNGAELMIICGLVVVILLLGMIALQAVGAASRSAGLFRMLILVFSIIIAWKEGFTRADYGHQLIFGRAAQTLAIFLLILILNGVNGRFVVTAEKRPAFGGMVPREIFAWSGMVAVMVVTCLMLFEVSRNNGPPMYSLGGTLSAWTGNVRALINRPVYVSRLDHDLTLLKQREAMPEMSRHIGSASVDVFGEEAGIAILNGWNYRPRPMFQSFSVYNRYLLDINRQYVDGEGAPAFYLVRFDPSDGRLADETDSEALEAILEKYAVVDAERGYLLFKRRQAFRQRVLSSGTASFHQWLPLSAPEPHTLDWMIADIRPSFLGKLRSLLIGAAPVTLRLQASPSGTNDFRLIPGLARSGIPINPPIYGVLSFPTLLSDLPGDTLARFSIEVAPEDQIYFEPTFPYSVVRRTFAIGSPPEPAKFSRFAGLALDVTPTAISSPLVPRMFNLGEHPILFVQAPSRVTLPSPEGATRIKGSFGVLNGAFAPPYDAKTIQFSVTVTGSAGEQVIFSQDMRKSATVPFEVALPAGDIKQVYLNAGCKPDCNAGWTFWQGVGFSH